MTYSSVSPETREDCPWHQTSVSVCSGTFKSWMVDNIMPYCQPAVSQSSYISSLLFLSFQCPHELVCPKLAVDQITPCNFQQMYHPLPLPGVTLNSELYVCLQHPYWKSNISKLSVKVGLRNSSLTKKLEVHLWAFYRTFNWYKLLKKPIKGA